ERPGLIGAFLSVYGLTMTNPMTILSFGAIFAGLGLTGGSGAEAALLTIGVFLGSAAWWVLLTTVIAIFRERMTPRVMLWINRLSGAVMVGFGIVALVGGGSAVLSTG